MGARETLNPIDPAPFQAVDLERRRTWCAAVAAVASFWLPARHGLASDFWSQPRRLWLQRQTPRGTEVFSGVYFADGRLQVPEYMRLCHLLRDVRAQQYAPISPVLLDVLCGLQGVLAARGLPVQPLMTTSAYRSPESNAAIEGAARDSLHTQGRAWDGHTPAASTAVLAEMAQYLRGGGVGVYIERGFCHLDDGRLRSWRG